MGVGFISWDRLAASFSGPHDQAGVFQICNKRTCKIPNFHEIIKSNPCCMWHVRAVSMVSKCLVKKRKEIICSSYWIDLKRITGKLDPSGIWAQNIKTREDNAKQSSRHTDISAGLLQSKMSIHFKIMFLYSCAWGIISYFLNQWHKILWSFTS